MNEPIGRVMAWVYRDGVTQLFGLGKHFQNGHVYEITEVAGELMIRDLGPGQLPVDSGMSRSSLLAGDDPRFLRIPGESLPERKERG